MRSVIQRVKAASVAIDGKIAGRIKKGLLVFFAVHQDDTAAKVPLLAEKILNLRIFSDKEGKMNLSLKDIGGEILVVSQFTLYGDASKGKRPSFINSAKPDIAIPIYQYFVEYIRKQGVKISTGEFGRRMEVSLVNDGPVTLIIEK